MKTSLKHLVWAVALPLGAALAAAPALADFITLPVKWSQPITNIDPDPATIDGVLLSSDHTVVGVKADDFISDGRPIVAVRWWGGYISDAPGLIRPTGFTGPFDISFHLSAGSHPGSLPVDPFLFFDTVTAQEDFVGFNSVGESVYRYDAFLHTPFPEVAGTEYFIDIDKPTGETWGWQTVDISLSPILDFAAFSALPGGGHLGPWASVPDDFAFELMTPEPSTVILAAMGLVGFAAIGWRRRKR